ncbi:MAG: DUF1273 family protein [Clostridia bacterium]|nr:DUF1273 family protein [Clostridia bacterium]
MTIDERFVSVCFTGHRVLPQDTRSLKKSLDVIIEKLYGEGMRIFYAGGAVGFDMLASEAVAEAKSRREGMELRLLIPCEGHDLRWGDGDRRRLAALKAAADSVEILSPVFTPWCMHERNRRLVERSAVCVAFLRHSEGGTASTVKYADKKGLRIINVPDAPEENP